MDAADQKPSPRREVQLQGPRPSPLRVSKDSHKIRKPPLAPSLPPPEHQPHQHQHQHQPRAPVIIYTVSPKVIHTEPGDFMMLVQRLTGASPTALSAAAAAAPPSASLSPGASGSLSPAARLAAIEGSRASPGAAGGAGDALDIVDQLGGAAALDALVAGIPGILSPLPSALPPISPSFFSAPAADPASLAFLNDMSPVFRGGRGFLPEAPFLPSPSGFLSTPTFPSPGALWDLFGQL